MIISEDQEVNEQTVFHPSDAYRQNAHISSIEEYRKMYKKSIEQPEEFWRAFFDEFHFKSGPTGPSMTYNFDIRKGPIEIRWFEGAITNICFNLLDRNVARGFGDRVAYIWEGNEPDQTTSITYHELLLQVCKFSNVLLQKGIKKGDRIAIYLPVTIELVISMLACARIGAVHSVIFAGFSGDSIADRILDCDCKLLVTCDGVFRGTKFISLKAMADDAIRICKQKNHTLNACIVYHHLKNNRKVTARLAYTNEEILPVAQVKKAKEDVVALEACNRSESPEIHSAQSSPISDANDSGVESDEVKRSSRSHSPSSSVASSSDLNALASPCRSPANSTSSSIQTSDDSTDIDDTLTKQAPSPSFAFAKQAAPCEREAESDSIEITIPWDQTLDFWWHDLMASASEECEPCWVDAEHPLFILYTSGSTGKPKGVVHSTAGYMIYAATAFKYVFNYIGGDVFFCTADLGWITGHTVNCYGSLANAATIVLFDGTPFYPTPARLCEMIERHKVNTFYTAPTAIRSLMGYGDKWVKGSDVSSLKLLGTAGEPINKEAWLWYYQKIGNSRCPIVDTFWQTETGAPVLTPLPGCTPLKPGSATLPFFGVQPALLDDEGHELIGPATGHLVFKSPWPAMMRTVDGNHHRFQSTYFTKFPGYYCAGDGVKRDKDGYYWITGRTDDLLNVSGHLMSTSQIEGAIAVDERVAETAVVSATHQIKGQCVYCFLVLKADVEAHPELDKEIKAHIRHSIGAIAVPDVLQTCRALPKTRSGKIMRRLLKQIAEFNFNFGDISTLQDESVLDELIEVRKSYPKLS